MPSLFCGGSGGRRRSRRKQRRKSWKPATARPPWSTPARRPSACAQLLEAGVHFGHNTGRWNPKMKPFIFGARNGIHIIDLQHTVKMFRYAFQAVIDICARGEQVLFVGTKKQAQDVIREEAARAGQFHVTQRWLGGTLTNFKTVKGSLERLRDPREDGRGRHPGGADQEGAGPDPPRDREAAALAGRHQGHVQAARRPVRHRSQQGAHRRRPRPAPSRFRWWR